MCTCAVCSEGAHTSIHALAHARSHMHAHAHANLRARTHPHTRTHTTHMARQAEEIKKIQAALNVMVNDKTKAQLAKGKKKGKANLKSLSGGKVTCAPTL